MTPKHFRKTHAVAVRPLAAIALVAAAACAAPILATESASGRAIAADAPVQCGIATETRGAMTTFRPWVRGRDDLAGSYRFELGRAGTAVDQAGDFESAAGRAATLGEATMSGLAASYDMHLTVTVGGKDYVCHGDTEEI